MSHPTVSGLLSRLEKKEFIVIRPDETDRRCKRIRLLPKGEACHQKMHDVIRETEEKLVVYRQLYGSGDMWVRPISMWNETVEVDGVSKPRFEFIGDNDLHSGAAIPVEQAFDGVPRGEAFIRY